MNYLAYEFIVNPVLPGNEVLMAFMEEMPFESFEENEQGFTAFINEANNHEVNLSELPIEGIEFTYSIKKIETVNWNQEWERNFERVDIAPLISIRAPFHAPNPNTAYDIIISPKMSFGTGHHATTQLMCQLMGDLRFDGKQVLDMGCGTGVLSIFAEKLGAAKITGIDIDDWSIENSKENALANQSKNIEFIKSEVHAASSSESYQIILANINKNVLKNQLPFYSKLVSQEGYLIMSGFFTTDVEELIKLANDYGFILIKQKSKSEWSALLFQYQVLVIK